jgi:hypothetical protein
VARLIAIVPNYFLSVPVLAGLVKSGCGAVNHPAVVPFVREPIPDRHGHIGRARSTEQFAESFGKVNGTSWHCLL